MLRAKGHAACVEATKTRRGEKRFRQSMWRREGVDGQMRRGGVFIKKHLEKRMEWSGMHGQGEGACAGAGRGMEQEA